MPRLTSDTYYQYHCLLRELWRTQSHLFARMAPEEQWLLHDFFQPSRELTREQALTYRKEISRAQPSLSARAGKTLNKAALVPGAGSEPF